VTRYRHVLDEAHGLDTARVALLAVLLLRGPQTPGELRARTARLAEFDSLDTLQAELQILGERPEPLVRLLPRQPGQKEDRWQQLLATESDVTVGRGHPGSPALGSESPPQAFPVSAGEDDPRDRPGDGGDGWAVHEQRIEELASEVAALRKELREVDASLASLRRNLGE
jgi:uncharacterized protein